MDFLISVIIPIYNVENYIERCARSLFEQTLPNIEYIFIDDSSSDNSMQIVREILEEYPDRKPHSQFHINAKNIGVAGTRNVGLDKAGGRYITFCDADDWIDREGYAEMYQASGQGNMDIVWCDYYNSFETGETYVNQDIERDPIACLQALLTEKLHGSLCNKLFARDLFIKHDIRFIEGLNMWEDLRACVQLFYFSRSLAHIPRAYYHYVQYNSGSISNKTDKKKLNEALENTKSILEFITKHEIADLTKESMILKLAAKQTLLFKVEKEAFVKWRSIFPEANSYIWSFSSLPLHLRYIGWCATHKIWPIIYIWTYFKQLRNKNK